MRSKSYCLLFAGAVALFLTACSGDRDSGPIDVKWDRDACERCRMVLSDRHYAAQIRYLPEGKKRTKVVLFDDIGCATLWLEDKPWKDDSGAEIWVADYRTGEWIDARKATYVKSRITPMGYGLGAQSVPVAGGLSFIQAKQHILEVEERFNVHGVHLLDKLKEQAAKRSNER